MSRRVVRIAVTAVAVYLAAVVTAQLVIAGAVVVTRMTVGDPRSDEIEGIANFRMVDAKVWFGAQPDPEEYAALARRGVRTVIDLRTGADDDERLDDEEALRALGISHRWIPVPDGHAPSRQDIRRLLAIVASAQGAVFVHCGGGVGRTTAMQSAYVAASGREPSLAEHVAVGPLTVEQAWVVATARAGSPGTRNVVVRRVSEALDAPRRAISRLRALP